MSYLFILFTLATGVCFQVGMIPIALAFGVLAFGFGWGNYIQSCSSVNSK